MNKIILFFFIFAANAVACVAEEKLHVSGFQAVPDDSTAIASPVRDNNGDPCALMRVYIDDPSARFNGEIIGDPVHKESYFELWLLNSTQRIEVISQKAVPVWVEFADYGIDEVESGKVYSLTLAAPPVNYQGIKNPGTINFDFFPYGAIVFIDKKKAGISPCTINGLEKGKHKITVWAKGFNTYEEDVKIQDWTPIDLKGSLLKKYTATSSFTYIGNKYKKEDRTETKNGKSVTKKVAVASGHDTTYTKEDIILQFAFVDPALFGKDEMPYGIMEDKVTNRLWRIIMGAENEHASHSESEIIDPFYHNNKVEVPADDAKLFCEKLSELYGRNIRLASFDELRWAQQMKNIKGLGKNDSEWTMEESAVGDKKRKFRVVLADVTEADIDLGDTSSLADGIDYKYVKKASKEGKSTGWAGRVAGGLLKDAIKITLAN